MFKINVKKCQLLFFNKNCITLHTLYNLKNVIKNNNDKQVY